MRYLTIEFRDTCVIEFTEPQSNEPVHVIQRHQIRGISFQRGLYAERPRLQLAVATTLILVGVCLLGGIFLGGGSGLSPKLLATACMPFVFGVLALRDSARRGPYLRVETEKTVKKLRLPKEADETAVSQFLSRVMVGAQLDGRDGLLK